MKTLRSGLALSFDGFNLSDGFHLCKKRSNLTTDTVEVVKWIRTLFRSWQKRIPYDEIRYLRSFPKAPHRCSHSWPRRVSEAFMRLNLPLIPSE